MKRLFVIRHAKSAHDAQYRSDFERPLNSRGRSDAKRMAGELLKRIGHLDQILVSSAERTRQTAAFFMDTFQLESSQVDYIKKLYLPMEKDIWTEVRKAGDDCENVAVITHNPAAEDILQRYRPGAALPTCSIVSMDYEGAHWSDLDPNNVRFISHVYPKLYV